MARPYALSAASLRPKALRASPWLNQAGALVSWIAKAF